MQRTYVRSDVLPGLAIAARRAEREHAILIDHAQRHAVDLRLAGVYDGCIAVEQLAHTRIEVDQFVMGRALAEAHHGNLMAHFGQTPTGLGADALGRGVRRNQLWMRSLERDHAVEKCVVLSVGYARRIENMIGMVVGGDGRAQTFELSCGIDVGRGTHGSDRLLRPVATSVDA